MNLFALDYDARQAARAHCDRHVGKMALEALYLMAGAHELVDFLAGLRDYDKPHRLPPRFRDRACARWVRETRANYQWTHDLVVELCLEYHQRYGHPHEAALYVDDYADPPVGLTLELVTPFGQSISPHAPGADPVLAYRRYYACRKWSFARWQRGRNPPSWWLAALDEVGKRQRWEAEVWPK